ncbi:hypothetical protein OE88DRAFT_1659738 [Heliocybe sulcata]|uniref:C2H2-type domain-containing protein n=1 Tax=Heliocybe sulcata TaxID=5364 RepID=A0A5C3N2R0_9AGAM|nr:hypothetical protein OE88DRAFT_1659738 [Heliocybe sulcata]
MPSIFTCVPSCGKSYGKQVTLTLHQRSCDEYKRPNPKLANIASRIAEKKARKRRRLEEPDASHVQLISV